jgi:virginiamycin B lyase
VGRPLRASAAVVVSVIFAVAGAFGAAAAAPGSFTTFNDPDPLGWTFQPTHFATGSEGDVWYTTGGRIARITTAGVITGIADPETPIVGASRVAAGPGNNMWFRSDDGIGYIEDDNSVTLFPIESLSSQGGLVAGADGNVWATDPQGSQIFRVTPTGTVDSFTTSRSVGANLTVAGDDKIWFGVGTSDSLGPALARIDAFGEVPTYFPLPAGVGPTWMTTGADGRVWFVASRNGEEPVLGVATTAGVVTTIDVPGVGLGWPFNSVPTLGPDGNIWITDSERNGLLRVTPAGEITPVFDPDGELDLPIGITTGSDGALWFGSALNNRVARFDPTVVVGLPDGTVRKPNKAFRGENIYNATTENQTVTQRIRRATSKTLEVRVTNNSIGTDSLVIARQGGAPRTAHFRTTYKHNGVNITDAVTSDGYETAPLDAGESITITVTVKAKPTAQPNKEHASNLQVTSAATPAAIDVVGVIVKAS